MRSTTGKYYINLDLVRAFAVFLVFMWHFNHFRNGNIRNPLIFPSSILTEGHTGVSIFLVLSGYLFAKLLDSGKLDYGNFLRNRLLRLLPLLVFVIIVGIIQAFLNANFSFVFMKSIFAGAVLPTLPNGGWSITVELHFYILLPLLLLIFLQKRFFFSICVIGLLILTRYIEYRVGLDIKFIAYSSILGRLDQFAFGILAYRFKERVPRRKVYGVVVSSIFLIYFYTFDLLGGYYGPFRFGNITWIWIFELTIEGFFYAFLIAWFDKQQVVINKFTIFLSKIGQWSYSIYLLHCFFIFTIPGLIDRNLINLGNPYIRILAGFLSFFLFLPIPALSYQFLESPFLKYRRNYIK